MQSSTLQGLVQFLTFYYCALWLTQLYIVECYDLLGWKPIIYLPVHSKKMFLVMIEISKIYVIMNDSAIVRLSNTFFRQYLVSRKLPTNNYLYYVIKSKINKKNFFANYVFHNHQLI